MTQEKLYMYQSLAAALFSLGVVGVLVRRNALVVFMCVELMLNAANLSLVSFSRYWNEPSGSMFVFFTMCVAACEAVVGLAILIALFRHRLSVNTHQVNLFKW